MAKFNTKLAVKYQIAGYKIKVLTPVERDIVVFCVIVQSCSPEGSPKVFWIHTASIFMATIILFGKFLQATFQTD
jgi:hypothetical protein